MQPGTCPFPELLEQSKKVRAEISFSCELGHLPVYRSSAQTRTRHSSSETPVCRVQDFSGPLLTNLCPVVSDSLMDHNCLSHQPLKPA